MPSKTLLSGVQSICFEFGTATVRISAHNHTTQRLPSISSVSTATRWHAALSRHWTCAKSKNTVLEEIDNLVRYEVLTEVKMLMLVFRVVTLCELAGRYQRFGETYCFHHEGVVSNYKSAGIAI
jgi:hypothetical protein